MKDFHEAEAIAEADVIHSAAVVAEAVSRVAEEITEHLGEQSARAVS